MLLHGNCGLDDGRVEGEWDQADDEGILANLMLEGGLVGDIKRDGVAVLQTLGELLGGFECSAG